MIDELLAWAFAALSDPLFLPFLVGGIAASAGGFLLVAIPLTAIAWRAPARLERCRIQERRPPDPSRLIHEGLRAVVVNHACMARCPPGRWSSCSSWCCSICTTSSATSSTSGCTSTGGCGSKSTAGTTASGPLGRSPATISTRWSSACRAL